MHDPRLFRPHGPHDPDNRYLHEHVDDEPFEQGFVPPHARLDDPVCTPPAPTPACLKCHSAHVEARHRARKTGGAIGTLAGTTSGIALALSGAETGAVAGSLAGPAGTLCGAIAGAVIAGLIVGAAGCAAGSAFGEIVDDKVLDNFRCHACGHTFSRAKSI